eukprot:gene21673-8361_t
MSADAWMSLCHRLREPFKSSRSQARCNALPIVQFHICIGPFLKEYLDNARSVSWTHVRINTATHHSPTSGVGVAEGSGDTVEKAVDGPSSSNNLNLNLNFSRALQNSFLENIRRQLSD